MEGEVQGILTPLTEKSVRAESWNTPHTDFRAVQRSLVGRGREREPVGVVEA